MDTFSHIIDSLIKNDPVEARGQIRALLKSGTLTEEHWTAAYGTLRLTTKAIEGRGHNMYADTRKAWWGHYTAQALEELRTHLAALKNGAKRPAKTATSDGVDKSIVAREGFSRIIDLLIKNDPVAARKQINLFVRSGDLPQKDWPTLHGILLIVTKAIDGRGDFMHADTRKAWRDHYTAKALDELCAYLGFDKVINFPVVTAEAVGEAA
jgi:hypothetical protein